MKKLVILGNVPAKKNNKQFVRNGNRTFLISSKLYKQWETDALWQLKGKPAVANYPIAMTCVFYMKNNRARDLDNCLASVQDVLVAAGILEDDCWQKLCPVTLDCAGVDKLNPRVEIYLED